MKRSRASECALCGVRYDREHDPIPRAQKPSGYISMDEAAPTDWRILWECPRCGYLWFERHGLAPDVAPKVG